MTAFSDNMVATARRLLTSFGEEVTVTSIAQGAYDSGTGDLAAGSTTNYTGYAAPFNYARNEIDGTNVLVSDVRIMLEQITVEPLVGDQVAYDSKNYKVINVGKEVVSSVDVIYILQLRI